MRAGEREGRERVKSENARKRLEEHIFYYFIYVLVKGFYNRGALVLLSPTSTSLDAPNPTSDGIGRRTDDSRLHGCCGGECIEYV